MFHRKLIVLLLSLCFFAYGDYFALDIGLGWVDLPHRIWSDGGDSIHTNFSALCAEAKFGYYDHDIFNVTTSFSLSAPSNLGLSLTGAQSSIATYTQVLLSLELFVLRVENFGISIKGFYNNNEYGYDAYGSGDLKLAQYYNQRNCLGCGISIYPLVHKDAGGFFVSADVLYDYDNSNYSLPFSIGFHLLTNSFEFYYDVLNNWNKWGFVLSFNVLPHELPENEEDD